MGDRINIYTHDQDIRRITDAMTLWDKMGIPLKEMDNMDAYDKALSLLVINRIDELEKRITDRFK